MPKSASEVFNALALKAGMKADDPALKDLLSATELQNVQVPDDLIVGIDKGLLSVDAAKNNHPDIKKHYFAQAFNGVDSELNSIMEALKVDDSIKAQVVGERSTPKRIGILIDKIAEAEQKKSTSTDTDKTKSLNAEILELRNKLAAEAQKETSIRADYEGRFSAMRLNQYISKQLSGYKTIFDEMPQEAREAALNALFNKSLQEKNAELKEDAIGNFTLVRKDGANVFGDDNRIWEPKTLFDFALSQNKVLKNTDPKNSGANTSTQTQGNTQNRQVIADNGNQQDSGRVRNSALAEITRKALQDQENAAKVPMM